MNDNYNVKKGVFCILLAGVGFSLMSVFVRMSGDLPVAQKAFFRNAVAAVLALILLLKNSEGNPIHLEKKNIIPMFVRCLAGTIGIFCNFWAIDRIGLAQSNLLNKMSPFFAIIFAAILLKDKPKKVDIICILVALLGVAFVVKPGTGLFNIAALAGLFGGIMAGLAYTCVRILGIQQVRGELIVVCFSFFSSLSSIPLIIVNHASMSAFQVAMLCLAGVSATLGQMGITKAYTYAPPKEISIYDYSQILYAAVFAFFIWGEVPDVLSIIGFVLIISAAAYRWNKQRK